MGNLGVRTWCAHCRLEDAIAAKQDDIARLQAKQAMSEKALDLGAAQVADLKEALQEQGDSLESSEAARNALKVNPHPLKLLGLERGLQAVSAWLSTCLGLAADLRMHRRLLCRL